MPVTPIRMKPSTAISLRALKRRRKFATLDETLRYLIAAERREAVAVNAVPEK